MRLELYFTLALGALLIILKIVGFVSAAWPVVMIPFFVGILLFIMNISTSDDDLTPGA